jgi:hypothetical protein
MYFILFREAEEVGDFVSMLVIFKWLEISPGIHVDSQRELFFSWVLCLWIRGTRFDEFAIVFFSGIGLMIAMINRDWIRVI